VVLIGTTCVCFYVYIVDSVKYPQIEYLYCVCFYVYIVDSVKYPQIEYLSNNLRCNSSLFLFLCPLSI